MAQQRTVLVTGVAGYLGSVVALAFLDAGWKVVGIDNLVTGRREAVPDGVDFQWASIGEGDVMRHALKDVDIVSHCAARMQSDDFDLDPFPYIDTNVVHSVEMLKACCDMGVRGIVYAATNKNGGTPYHWSKRVFGEILKDLWQANGTPSMSLLYCNIVGAPKPHPRLTGKVARFQHERDLMPQVNIQAAADIHVILAGLMLEDNAVFGARQMTHREVEECVAARIYGPKMDPVRSLVQRA